MSTFSTSRRAALVLAAVIACSAGVGPAAQADDRMARVLGAALFERAWVPAPSSTTANDGLGPLFNARACVSCHRGLDRWPVRTDADGRVTEVAEKPDADQLVPGEPYRINAGTYVLSPSARGAIPHGQQVSIERDTFPLLAARGGVGAMASDCYWRDIGTPGSYLDAHLDLLSGRVDA